MTETLSDVLPDEIEAMMHRLLVEVCDKELMLATAESCTGGMLASLLTDVQGVAHAFERGFVTYTEEAKSEMLGVPIDLIDERRRGLEARSRSRWRRARWSARAPISRLPITGFAD